MFVPKQMQLFTTMNSEIRQNFNMSEYTQSYLLYYNSTDASEINLEIENNLDDSYTPYSERPETYIVPIVFAIIFVVGVLGNGTLVITFMRHRAMRNIPNT